MRLFPTKRKELQGVPWGLLYNRFKDAPVSNTSAVKMEARLQTLIDDEDIERFTSGAYEYLIDGDERHLSFRAFPAKIRQKVYASQKGVCPHCGGHFDLSEMEADHITPWKEGGRTVEDNCQMLCRTCNRMKGAK